MEEQMNNQKTEGRGRLAVVTGASSGIGYELAKVFAKNGFDLIIAAESAEIEDVAQELQEFGTKVVPVQADLATYEGVERLSDEIQASESPVDAVAINAGVGVSGEFENTDLAREMNLLNLNIVSPVHLTKRVLPDMLARGRGRILYTSSIAADMPGPYYAVYAASVKKTIPRKSRKTASTLSWREKTMSSRVPS